MSIPALPPQFPVSPKAQKSDEVIFKDSIEVYKGYKVGKIKGLESGLKNMMERLASYQEQHDEEEM